MASVVRLTPKREFEFDSHYFVDLTALPMPKLGSKCWLLDRKGQFVLERCPGTLRIICCTHAGSGTLSVIDGYIGDDDKPRGAGRELFKANPVVMGAWMLDAGFSTGLTIRHYGGPMAAPAIASITWLPFRTKS